MSRALVFAALLFLGLAPAYGQPPAATVRFTQAKEANIASSITLTGTVEARTSSVIAAAVAGTVDSLAAREGDFVKKGAPLVRLDGDPTRLRLESARGQLDEAEARLRLAVRSRERFQGLYEEQVVSRQELDDAESEYEAWRGRKTQLQAEVGRLELELARSVIRAPFSGVVVSEETSVGEWLGVGDPAAALVNLTSLEVTVEVPERSFAGLNSGATVPVRFQALGGYEVEGKVRAIVPQADLQSRSFPVKVSFANPEQRVGVGMLGEVRLPVGDPRSQVVVPKDAIVARGRESLVYVMTDDGGTRPVQVRTGTASGAWIAVEGGVSPGDRVITRGNERLFPGQPVQGEELEYPD